jgi:hypothetical protein
MKFRKKPVVVEAVQFPADGIRTQELSDFLGWQHDDDQYNWLTIETLEGDHKAMPGDWIIKGIKGEFYPCKPDIFEATYDAVSVEYTIEDQGPMLTVYSKQLR